MLRMYPYENTMTGQEEWIVEDTVLNRDVKTFAWFFPKARATLYIKTHRGA
jgi:hypothetical protein